jgi:thiol-disulfide isomerase/thioredoxin
LTWAPTPVWGGASTEDKLLNFQKFVNGELAVKEAVMCRQVAGSNGVVLNREWWRFGCQKGTWFVQRLNPAGTNSPKLVPLDSTVCGASFAQYWVISDENLHLAGRDEALEHSSWYDRILMIGALSLGIPRQVPVQENENTLVKWNGLEFNTVMGTKWDPNGEVVATAPLRGELELGANGLPATARFSGGGQLSSATITYEYPPDTEGIPSVFVIKYPGTAYRYEFLSLTVGSNDLAKTEGYVPSMFADMKTGRTVMLWTNELPYEQKEGKSYPAFTGPEPELGKIPPRLQGTNWLNGSAPLTLEGLRGKVVLLDFWGVYCAPCIEALPHSEALYRKYRDQGLAVIGVCGGWGTDEKAARILKNKNITFPNLADQDLAIADGEYGATARSYVLHATPWYVLIDKSGNLVWKSALGEAPTESQIEELLGRWENK